MSQDWHGEKLLPILASGPTPTANEIDLRGIMTQYGFSSTPIVSMGKREKTFR